MEDEISVRKLVELIFVKNFGTEQTIALDEDFPNSLVANDFPHKLRYVVLTRQALIAQDWEMDSPSYDSIPSWKLDYPTRVLLACHGEYARHVNIFQSFISVCSIVRYYSHKTLQLKGKDFRDMNFDIFMEFYRRVLQNTFCRRGGFQHLIEYIQHHEYLAWNLDINDLAYLDDPSDEIKVYVAEKLRKQAARDKNPFPLKIDGGYLFLSISMAKTIISTRSLLFQTDHGRQNKLEIPFRSNTLKKCNPIAKVVEYRSFEKFFKTRLVSSNCDFKTNHNSNKNLVASERNRNIATDVKSECSENCLNSDTKSSCTTNQEEDISWYENIINAVKICNNMKSLTLSPSSDNYAQRKTDGFMENIKNIAKTLIQNLI